MRLFFQINRITGKLAHGAGTIGQIAMVALGVHLAADQLDEWVATGLFEGQLWAAAVLGPRFGAVAEFLGCDYDSAFFWESIPVGVSAAWSAFAIEVAAIAVLSGAIALTERTHVLSWRKFRQSLCIHGVVMPVVLTGVVCAGAWSLAMTVEDTLPPHAAAPWLGGFVAIAALIQFGWPALKRAIGALDRVPKWHRGWGLLPVLIPIGILAWRTGVPIWGWL